MKIVLVHNTYQQPGGEDIAFQNERDLLRDVGLQVVVYQRSNFEANRYAGFFGQIALAKHTVWASDTRREFRELLATEKPDLVHVHNTFAMISPSIYWACREARVPVAQTLHNFRLLCPGGIFLRENKVCEECVEHSLWRGIRYGCYRGSHSATAVVCGMLKAHRLTGTWSDVVDHYIATTEFSRRKFVAAGFPAERISVKPNFVYPDPGPGVCGGEYALFVGRLSLEKGLHTLLTAWERLAAPILLHIVGDGPLRAELQRQAQQRSLSNVHFQGKLTRAETLKAIRGARFLVFPSECYEGFPMVIAEAFASATPVLCSRMGAMLELVDHGRTGLHFAPASPSDLAAQVTAAWSKADLLAAMGREARREYEVKFSPERNLAMLLGIYRRLLTRGAGRRRTREIWPSHRVPEAGAQAPVDIGS
jgi:glycosyltransferase involved in cell wall biosynthesis